MTAMPSSTRACAGLHGVCCRSSSSGGFLYKGDTVIRPYQSVTHRDSLYKRSGVRRNDRAALVCARQIAKAFAPDAEPSRPTTVTALPAGGATWPAAAGSYITHARCLICMEQHD
jgi:hypothetical protein